MRKMNKFVALMLAVVFLGCWGITPTVADELGVYAQGGVNLNGPSYGWWYGCSPTSAGMMMGYYDIHGYGGLSYSNLVPGGVAEGSTFPSTAGTWQYLAQYTIASPGNVADFYSGAYGTSGDDVKTPFHSFNCLADFMGTSQDSAGNSNGSTTFYFWQNGAKTYAKNVIGLPDGMLGMDEYFRYAGYGTGDITQDMSFYTQLIYSTSAPQGCTFAQYKKMIDDGLVVMIQVAGHSMFGYGYTDDGKIIFDDTWGGHGLTMDWGGSYSGPGFSLAQWGITVFDPTGGSPVPLPSTFLLMVSGLACLAGLRGRFRQQ
jgi:hypothetical protein